MIITSEVLNALRTSGSAAFVGALQGVVPQFEKVATTVSSTSKSNTYGWLGKMPGMREWIGPREHKSMKEHSYSITNRKFEETVDVARDDIEDDLLGTYRPLFSELGRSAAILPDELVFGLLASGFTENCYDGKKFFAADHKRYANADGTGTATNVSNMMSETTYTGDAWYLLDTSRSVKPLIFQDRRKPSLVARTNLNDPSVFENDTFVFGADMRCNAGFGFWQMAFGAKAELNAENLKAARAAMRGFKADGGKQLGIKPNLLVVPASLEDKARTLLEREMTSEVVTVQTGVDGSGNPVYAEQTVSVSNDMKGAFELLVADYL